MWGIVPAAGKGSRIQPLAFSKELLPLGGNYVGASQRPRAVSDFLIERFIAAGARRICFVIAPGKSDIFEYYARATGPETICYAVQPEPAGLCDAIFRALPIIDPHEHVLVGLPDTIWFPADGLARLPDHCLSFLLFPVEEPRHFDSVECDERGAVTQIRVKDPKACSPWIWGAFKLPGAALHALYELWIERGRSDEYIGTLVNAWIARGGEARGIRAGETYYDVGTMEGYLRAMNKLSRNTDREAQDMKVQSGVA
ncbi:MAG TPA: sugar phosphate nucleotidyltransferase [Bryobacteraceae bacterium]|jgi:dTDP-glucose pyrophosphorylase|nr:sugar phosphate nucleotidyltransferase [Bryobacteraceae bacterium]